MVIMGNGELGFDSGDGALEMAPTSKGGCRRENYPLLTKGASDEIYWHEGNAFVIEMGRF